MFVDFQLFFWFLENQVIQERFEKIKQVRESASHPSCCRFSCSMVLTFKSVRLLCFLCFFLFLVFFLCFSVSLLFVYRLSILCSDCFFFSSCNLFLSFPLCLLSPLFSSICMSLFFVYLDVFLSVFSFPRLCIFCFSLFSLSLLFADPLWLGYLYFHCASSDRVSSLSISLFHQFFDFSLGSYEFLSSCTIVFINFHSLEPDVFFSILHPSCRETSDMDWGQVMPGHLANSGLNADFHFLRDAFEEMLNSCDVAKIDVTI